LNSFFQSRVNTFSLKNEENPLYASESDFSG
jgi:hypothetical protein